MKQVLANNIAQTKSEIEAKLVTLRLLADSLLKEVGEEGATFKTDWGAVQVTQKTQDRQGNDLRVSFNLNKWHDLDKRTQARLVTLGLVSVDRTTITGQAPKVIVRLA